MCSKINKRDRIKKLKCCHRKQDNVRIAVRERKSQKRKKERERERERDRQTETERETHQCCQMYGNDHICMIFDCLCDVC